MAAEATYSKSTGETAFEEKVVEAKEKTKENVTIANVDADRKLIIDLDKVNDRVCRSGGSYGQPYTSDGWRS